jgi:sugar phosphate isomerase/epimerase
MIRWEVGLSTGIAFRHPIADALPPIAQAGFRAIEVSTAPQHLDLSRPDPEALGRQIAEHGLRVHSLHAPFGVGVNFTSPDAGERQRALERLACAAETLERLGGGLYVIHPGGEDQRWIWERESRLALSVDGLTRVWEECHARGLDFVVETPLPHLLGGQPDDLAWILDRIPTEGTGVCVDTSHTALGGFLFDVLDRFAGRIVHIQASDNRGVADDHLPPGAGNLDWKRVVVALERIGYAGVFMLEVAGNGDIQQNVNAAAAAARAVLGAELCG